MNLEPDDELLQCMTQVLQADHRPMPVFRLIKEAGALLGRRPSREELTTRLPHLPPDLARLVEQPTATAQPSESTVDLVLRWLRAGADRNSALADEIRGCLSAAPAELATVAAGLGLVDPGPTVSDMPTLGYPDPILDALAARALRAGNHHYLLRLIVDGKPRIAKPYWAELEHGQQSQALVRFLDATDPLAMDIARSKQLGGLAKKPVAPSLAAAAARMASRMSFAEGQPEAIEVMVDVAMSPERPGDSTADLTVPQLASVALALAGRPCGPTSPRGRWIRHLANSGAAHVLGDQQVWAGVSAAELGQLLEDAAVASVLSQPVLARRVVTDTVARDVRLMRAWQIMELVGRQPALVEHVDADALAAAMRRSDASARLLRSVVDHSLQVAAHREAGLQGELAAAETRTAAAAVRIESMQASIDAASLRIIQLEQQVRDVMQSQRATHTAELNQARLDVLGALIAAAENLERLASVDGSGMAAARDMFRDVERTLADFGVRRVGKRGEIRSPDTTMDDLDHVDGASMVEVVNPGWVVAGEDVTLLRRTFVRKYE